MDSLDKPKATCNFFSYQSGLLNMSTISDINGAAIAIGHNNGLPIDRFVNIPKANKPSQGPYVMPANFKIKSIIEGSLINLNTSTNKKKIIAKLK